MPLKFVPIYKKDHINIIHDYGYDKTKNVLIKEQKQSVELVTCQGILGTINPYGQEITFNNPIIRLKQNYPICYFEIYDSSGNYINQHRINRIYTGKKGTYYEIKNGSVPYPKNEVFSVYINTNVVCCFSTLHSSTNIAKVYKNKETDAQTITDIPITIDTVSIPGTTLYNYEILISTLEAGFDKIDNIALAIYNIDNLSNINNLTPTQVTNGLKIKDVFFTSATKECNSNDIFIYRNLLTILALPTT